MANHGVRLLLPVAGLVVVIAMAGCGGGETVAPSAETATPVATQQKKALGSGPSQPTSDVVEVTADREVDELTGFISPTGNVACMVDPSWARCDIIDRDWSPPPRPADCEFDYGQGISLSPGEPAGFVCAGDTAFGPDEVLPYGSSIAAGVLQCDSADSGIMCRDVETGHGFSIARESYRLF